jgi:tartrate-resistant acid phosphatase type 5
MGRIGEKLDIDFVISTGDNFYENGLTGLEDNNFEESFCNVYTAKSLQKPWYSGRLIVLDQSFYDPFLLQTTSN